MQRILFLLLTLALISCSRRDGDAGDYAVFRYNESAGLSSLDPAYARDQAMIWAANQVFNGLVQLDDSLNVQPCIAHNWEISNDGLLYTFFLRDDVFFHDHPVFPNAKGRKLTAGDVVYSFNRILNPAVASPGAWVFYYVDPVNPFTALSDSIFQIRLKLAFSPFMGILSMPYCFVVPKEVVEAEGADFRKSPVGTGPFFFKYWKEGVRLVLLKNPNYFEADEYGKPYPYLDAVNVTFIIDKQAAFLEFVKGRLDFISGLDPSYKDEILTRTGKLSSKYEDRFTMITQPYLNVEYLGIQLNPEIKQSHSGILKEKKVRQAINHGFDRARMLKYLRNNIGTPGIYGMIPPGLPGFIADTLFPYDPQRAAQLLAEAGFPNGKGLPEIRLTTTASYLDLCIYLQNQLQQLGINMKIETSPPASLREMVAQARLPFFRASWIADYPDAENYLSLFYSPNQSPAGPNYTHFSLPEYDRLYRRASVETNDSIRLEIYKTMNRLLMEEAPVLILYYDQVLRFVRNDIEGLGSNPLNLLSLKKVKIIKP